MMQESHEHEENQSAETDILFGSQMELISEQINVQCIPS